jgi:protein-disulfide isomerase
MKGKISMMQGLALFLLVALNFPLACAQQQTQPAPAPAPAISNQQISDYVRKSFNVPPSVGIAIKDSPKSSIQGLREIRIEFTTERGPQTQEAWITPDNRLIVGRLFDLTVDPYKKNLDKIDLANAPTTGPSDAKVTIVEYSDFQCPYCSQAHGTIDQLLQQYQGKVKLVYKHLPLNMHNWAEDAAVASSCVAQQDNAAFWKLYDYLFTNQATITKETLAQKVIEATKDSKVNQEDLKKCVDSKATMTIVKANMTEAESLGLNSTPSFIINGRPVIGALELAQFKQVIDDALATAK